MATVMITIITTQNYEKIILIQIQMNYLLAMIAIISV